MKLWVLALTTAQQSDLALLVHPLVNLISGVIRLSNNMKYFPYQMKAFELLTVITLKTGQYVPAAQHMLTVFQESNYNYFNAKPKKLDDKTIPDTLICLKINKKHIDTSEMKDRIIKETISALTHYFAANAQSVALPEMMTPVRVILARFKKNCKNQNYRKNAH